MFVAPPEKEVEWTDSGLEGSFRFLARVWRLVDHWARRLRGDGDRRVRRGERLNAAERALRRKTHDTIRRVTADIEQRQQLNTAVSAMMELVNELYAFSEHTVTRPAAPPGRRGRRARRRGRAQRDHLVMREAIEALVRMLAPFAPHTAEELWEHARPRGRPDGGDAGRRSTPTSRKADEIVVPVQVNGKVRGRLTVAADTSRSRARARWRWPTRPWQAHIAGKTVKKVVVAKGRLVSIVVK